MKTKILFGLAMGCMWVALILSIFAVSEAWGCELTPCSFCSDGEWAIYHTHGGCPATNTSQVTAYKASDGKLFESRGEMEKYNKRLLNKEKAIEIFKLFTKILFGLAMGCMWVALILSIEAVVFYWPEIKAIMEGEKKQ